VEEGGEVMTDEELIARLLDWEEYDEGHINDAREAAANRIKELKAELAGGSFYQEKDIDALQDRLAAQAAEIERLRGDLAKAMEALRFYAWENEMRLPSEGPWGAGSTDFGTVARATLAELTGGKWEVNETAR
jgi:hypothetical protein